MNSDSSEYAQIIQQLPCPTLAQTERFARYVSAAHSWYKHLPIRPKVPFIFFLDPGSGMNYVRTPTGETALVEITDESNRFHYTWQKTEDYRRRFGYWNYHAHYGTTFLFTSDGGMVNTTGVGLKVLTETGNWVSVPSELTQKGTVLVNAFVHPCPNFVIWESDLKRFGLSDIPKPEEANIPLQANPLLSHLWSVLQQDSRGYPSFSEIKELILPQVLEEIKGPVEKRHLSLWLSPTDSGWDWPDENWLEIVAQSWD